MKPIKFNLSYGNEQIKTLAELKESCNIDMLLETLENGLLVRWLVAQGEVDLSEKIAKIDKSNYKKAVSELLTILFDKEATCIEQAAAELFSVREKEAKRLENLKKLTSQENEIIKQYHAGYVNVLKSLHEHSKDYALLKAQMTVLYTQYSKLLELDKTNFYETFKTGYPLVLLAFMANTKLRELIAYDSIRDDLLVGKKTPAILIENNEQLEQFKEKYGTAVLGCIYKSASNANTYSANMINVSAFSVGDYYIPLSELIVPHIKTFRGKTDAYWKDIEPRGKTFMIISMKEGKKLRNAGVTGEEMTAEAINEKFIFTDGIDYMSNSDSDDLIYMEV